MSETKKFVFTVLTTSDNYVTGFARSGAKEYQLVLPRQMCPNDACVPGKRFDVVTDFTDAKAERERIDQIYNDLEGIVGHS